jgi:hypothetical protein
MDKKYIYLAVGLIIGYLFLGSLLGGVSGFLSGGSRKAD